MNHTSRILTAPIQGSQPLDFEGWLALQMILKAKAEGDIEFFLSDWYLDLLAYLSYFFPHFNPSGRVLPEGIVSGSERNVVTE